MYVNHHPKARPSGDDVVFKTANRPRPRFLVAAAVPRSRISSLSSGEFVGMVADNPDEKIDLKTFHADIINDHAALKKEEEGYKEIPLIRKIDNSIVQKNYSQIKQDVQDIYQAEMERLLSDPALMHLVIRKG